MNFDIAQVYAHFRETGVAEAQKLGWRDLDAQQRNFKVMLDTLEDLKIPLQGLSVHDAGCGHGDLLVELEQRGGVRDYIGTDAMQAALDIARQRYPARDFRQQNLMDAHNIPEADVTLVFGTFAFYKPREVEGMLHDLWKHSKVALGFNTWWNLDPTFVDHERAAALQKCISRFLRTVKGMQVLMPGEIYGEPTEAMFILWR